MKLFFQVRWWSCAALAIWSSSLVIAEDAVVAFEAESFVEQTKDEIRAWHITKEGSIPDLQPDGDPVHLDGASGGAYIEILPDSRRNHSEKLIHGENFSPQPGKQAILSYQVKFPQAGKYYVWARAFSTGTEDNGFHIGLNGQWPESGQRWQTIVKKRWHWECKQRTNKVHIGVPMQLFLDIPSAGEHQILLSMREDGCELDKLILATDINYRPPGYYREGKSEKTKVAPVKIDRKADGDGSAKISGELKAWHKVSLTIDGPWAHERDPEVNPFTDIQCSVTFQHESGSPRYVVPGYFAADGNAAETSADSGSKWRAHLSPDEAGKWNYTVKLTDSSGKALAGDGAKGSFEVGATDKQGRDFRARGRLQYVGERYLKFAGDGRRFLKAGPDSPETFLAFDSFDGTTGNGLKSYTGHISDWNDGDPTWQGEKGKGIVGAINYLAGKGLNSFSFLTYNAGGDGNNVWPFVERDAKLHYDVSKLDQWGIVLDHATANGMHLHFKLQETEIDDNRRGSKTSKNVKVPTSLDGGKLGAERKLYLRELIARFGHNLALNWNIGEENTQTPEEVRDMATFIRDTDPYDHHIVIHSYPGQQDKVYSPLLGDQSVLTGASLQNPWDRVHERTLHWLNESKAAGKQWVVANDEQNPADLGVPPDPGYQGHSGWAEKDGRKYNLHDIRRDTLWGNLMAGGAGVEYYFGYKLPENDLKLEDFRSRDQTWDFCREAIEIFHQSGVPFWEMQSADALVGNPESKNGKPWCLAKPGIAYLIYIPDGTKAAEIDLSESSGKFTVTTYDPLGKNEPANLPDISGGAKAAIGEGKEQVVVLKLIN